jgi:hypothetical protein
VKHHYISSNKRIQVKGLPQGVNSTQRIEDWSVTTLEGTEALQRLHLEHSVRKTACYAFGHDLVAQMNDELPKPRSQAVGQPQSLTP